MSTEKGNAPAPLDPFGNELCLLFLKYGKCRYKKKCKLSHILPDKNAPIMQLVRDPVIEKPQPKPVPTIAFSITKTPYMRPASSIIDARPMKPRKTPTNINNTQNFKVSNIAADIENGVDKTLSSPVEGHDPERNIEPVSIQSPKMKKSKKLKPSRLLKKSPTPILASLFHTRIPLSEGKGSTRQVSADTYVITQPQGKTNTRTRSSGLGPRSNKRFKPTPTTHSNNSSILGPPSNSSEPNSERIEQWYITNNAHMEILPKSIPGGGGTPRRRLMTLTKPTSIRQKTQLKIMRKHHWECRVAIEQNLQRNAPAIYSLKIPRVRIDWRKIAPYITLMIQAAFEMDVVHDDLPIVGTTLCALLEHRELSAIECEKLLTLWGLRELDARRFTNHLWEVLMSAAGEADIRGGVGGVGFRVRQIEHKDNFKLIQSKLSAHNKSPH